MTPPPDASASPVHRSPAGRTLAWLWLVLAAVLLVDALRRGPGPDLWTALLLLAGTSAVAVVMGLRPAVVLEPDRMLVHTPVRDVSVPWGAVTGVEVEDVLRVQAGDEMVRCGAVPMRRPARGAPASTAVLVAEEVQVRARAWDNTHDEPATPVRHTLSVPAVALLAGGLVALAWGVVRL